MIDSYHLWIVIPKCSSIGKNVDIKVSYNEMRQKVIKYDDVHNLPVMSLMLNVKDY